MLLVRALVGTAVNINVNTGNPLPINSFSKFFFSHPAITDFRLYEHQIAVPRVSAITGVDCILPESPKLETTRSAIYSICVGSMPGGPGGGGYLGQSFLNGLTK